MFEVSEVISPIVYNDTLSHQKGDYNSSPVVSILYCLGIASTEDGQNAGCLSSGFVEIHNKLVEFLENSDDSRLTGYVIHEAGGTFLISLVDDERTRRVIYIPVLDACRDFLFSIGAYSTSGDYDRYGMPAEVGDSTSYSFTNFPHTMLRYTDKDEFLSYIDGTKAFVYKYTNDSSKGYLVDDSVTEALIKDEIKSYINSKYSENGWINIFNESEFSENSIILAGATIRTHTGQYYGWEYGTITVLYGTIERNPVNVSSTWSVSRVPNEAHFVTNFTGTQDYNANRFYVKQYTVNYERQYRNTDGQTTAWSRTGQTESLVYSGYGELPIEAYGPIGNFTGEQAKYIVGFSNFGTVSLSGYRGIVVDETAADQTASIYDILRYGQTVTINRYSDAFKTLVDYGTIPGSYDDETGEGYTVAMLTNAEIDDSVLSGVESIQEAAQAGSASSQPVENSIARYEILLREGTGATIDTGTGVLPPGTSTLQSTATGFLTIYDLTDSQLDAFARYMWSSSIVDDLPKLFLDPMQALISLQVLYAEPTISGSGSIQIGFLDSGVSASKVGSQYIDIDCGSIALNEFYHSVYDYEGTSVFVYLPFIGIQQIDIHDIMGGKMNITYRIDVLTGQCIAMITIQKGDLTYIAYQFSGNCSVQLPLTGANYSQIYAGLIGAVAGVAAGLVTGSVGAAASGLNGLANSNLAIQKSGNLSSNVGALAPRKPYIVIDRPNPYQSEYRAILDGYPSNRGVLLGQVGGYTRVRSVRVENIQNATANELSEIENILKTGVIV